MNWLNIILPILGTLLGVVIGWGLTRYDKLSAKKEEDTKKLKKLLFNLLRLRKLLKTIEGIDATLDKLFTRVKEMASYTPEITDDEDFELKKGEVARFVKGNFLSSKELEHLSGLIPEIALELSEVDPVFAYEIAGKYNLKDKLLSIDSYVSDVESLVGEIPTGVKEWVQPNIVSKIVNDLDENIRRISESIGKSTLRNVLIELEEKPGEEDAKIEKMLVSVFEKSGITINSNKIPL